MARSQSTKVSEHEQVRREQQRQRPAEQLLISRRDAAHVLGDVSTITLIRFEKEGRLTPVKLSRRKLGKTFYHMADIRALAQGG